MGQEERILQIKTISESLSYVVAMIVFPRERTISVGHRLVLHVLSSLAECSPLSLRWMKELGFSFSPGCMEKWA